MVCGSKVVKILQKCPECGGNMGCDGYCKVCFDCGYIM